MKLQDTHDHQLEGYIRVLNAETGEEVYNTKNVIVLGTKKLFSRIFATLGNNLPDTPAWAVWGLALGKGDPTWSPTIDYPAKSTQEELYSPLLRKKISLAQYVELVTRPDGTVDVIPTDGVNKGFVEYQTPLNATIDSGLLVNNEVQAIREMGLIGGGISTTNPLTAPMWTEKNNVSDSMTLINYKTLLPLILPKDVTFTISWTLKF